MKKRISALVLILFILMIGISEQSMAEYEEILTDEIVDSSETAIIDEAEESLEIDKNTKGQEEKNDDEGGIQTFENKVSNEDTAVATKKEYESSENIITGWYTKNGKKYYYNESGQVTIGLKEISGKEYYFDGNGVMQKEKLINVSGKLMYFSLEDGTRITSERWVNYYKHYIDGKTGCAVTGLYKIDGKYYYFDKNGLKQTSGWAENKKYYIDSKTGCVVTGLNNINGKEYYFDNSGVMQKGKLINVSGKLMYFSLEDGTRITSERWVNYYKHYIDGKNGCAVTGFKIISGNKYYFDKNGWIVTGLKNINGKEYYFDNNGVMQKGKLINVNGKLMYFSLEDGTRITSERWVNYWKHYIDGKTGCAVTGLYRIDGKYYYFDKNGLKKTSGWVENKKYYINPETESAVIGLNKIDGKEYYFDNDAVMQKGKLINVDGKLMYFSLEDGTRITTGRWVNYYKHYIDGNTGCAVTGFKTISGKKYYFDENGWIATGLKAINGKEYYFDNNGVMQKGKLINVDGKLMYFSLEDGTRITTGRWVNYYKHYIDGNTGCAVTGLKTISGKKYYFNENGWIVTGLKAINGKEYYFDNNGVMQKGKLINVDGKLMYFSLEDGTRITTGRWVNYYKHYIDGKTGCVVTGLNKIDGKEYYFDNNGVMQKGKLINVDGKLMYFSLEDGTRITSERWVNYSKHYIDDTTGCAVTGVHSIDGEQYYFDENGVLFKSGWFIFNNDQYYSNTTGTLATGLNTVNGKKYYFSDLGSMQTGDITLDDQTYYFNELGYMELRDNYSYMQEDYCYNIEKGKARIVWYDGTSTNIIVPSSIGDYPVIRIGNNAFFRSRNIIQNVVLENGITIIEENAFYACDKLKSITFPDSITRIGENAFGKCSSLEEVNMTDKAAVNIRDGAFEDCTSLKQIELSNRATVLSSVFARCTSLETVKLPAVYGEIPYKFFSGCTNLKNVEIPIYVKKIGDYAFENCTGLTALTIPKEVTTIGENAFNGCTDITLYVEKGSTAYTFALNNNINYVVMGEEVSNEPYRYYYYQLDDRAKILYDEIVDHLDAIKSGVDSIILSNKVNEYAQAHDANSFFDGVMQDAVDAFNLDYADVFYWDCTKTALSYYGSTFYFKAYNGASNFLEDEFNSATKVEIACNRVDTKINQIMSDISSDSTDYEIVAIVHDWLVDNLDYDYAFSTNCHNIYGTLVESKPVCEGYARTFKTLMDKYDIACIIVTGTGINSSGSEAHAWNYVQLDGEWYAMDVTWDDPKINSTGTPDEEWLNQVHHSYFLKGANDTKFMNSHILDDDFEVPTLNGSDYVGAA